LKYSLEEGSPLSTIKGVQMVIGVGGEPIAPKGGTTRKKQQELEKGFCRINQTPNISRGK